MLDRSQTANLFAENLPETAGQEDRRDGEPEPATPPPAPRSSRSPRVRLASPARSGSSRRRRPPVAPATGSQPWRERRDALRSPWGRIRRYVPVAVLLVILVADLAGRGRLLGTSTVTTAAPPTTTAPTARTVTVLPRRSPPHTSAVTRHGPRRPIGRLRVVHVPVPTPATKSPAPTEPALQVPPPVALPAPPVTQPVAAPAWPSPAPASADRPPPSEGGAQGDEFGFER